MADIELTQHLLGMRPYVLIEADKDPADGELTLKIKAGGGASQDIAALPFLMLTTMADSPIAEILREVRQVVEQGDPTLEAKVQAASLATIQRVAEAFGVTL